MFSQQIPHPGPSIALTTNDLWKQFIFFCNERLEITKIRNSVGSTCYQPVFKCSKLTIETKQGVKYVQRYHH